MSIQVNEAVKKPLGLTREGTIIKFDGVEVSKELDGAFDYEGFKCEVTSQDAEGRIAFKKISKLPSGVSEEKPEEKSEEEPSVPLNRDELLKEATELGLEFPSNIKTAKLVILIKEAREAGL